VTLGAFFLAQTSITQAQWRAVALWEKVERDLKLDPSRFKGPNRPMEQLSRFDAMEYCRRLRKRTGKSYGLPSEAQWEYVRLPGGHDHALPSRGHSDA
jgi:formylglycine-generating enzyme required for sulfatase activity